MVFVQHFINPVNCVAYNHCVLAHKHNFCKRRTNDRRNHNIEDKV